jgi:hypothetical protein
MKRSERVSYVLGAMAVFLLLAMPLFAQDTPVGPAGAQVASQATPAAATNAEELRKESQNPVASLISVPIQDNWNFNIGPSDRTQNVLNIQPVIPQSVSKDWNLIVRWITPIIYRAGEMLFGDVGQRLCRSRRDLVREALWTHELFGERPGASFRTASGHSPKPKQPH